MFDIVFILIIWSFVGYIISDIILCICRGNNLNMRGLEYLNPIWIYRTFRVNYLGVLLLTIFHNVLCPLGAMFYWGVKICTVGRE